MSKDGNILSLLRDFLPYIQEYADQKGEKPLHLRGFVFWLFQRLSNSLHEEFDYEKLKMDPAIGKAPLDMQVLYLTTHMHKFGNHYIKKALEGSDFVRPDDFHFLAVLMHSESMTKSELIYSNNTNMQSGIEVIKRLLKSSFIEEFQDPDDKRSKRVRITKTGFEEVMKVAGSMAKAGKILGANLSNEDKMRLVGLLNSMNEFHAEWFEKYRTSSLDELLEKHFSD